MKRETALKKKKKNAQDLKQSKQFLNPFEFPCLIGQRKNMLIHEN